MDNPFPITVRPGEPGRVHVRVPYSPENLALIKTFSGRLWLSIDKLWSLPDAPDLVDRLKAAFPAAFVEVLSTDVIKPSPEQGLRRRVADAVRARHFSPRTEEAYVGWITRFQSWSKAPIESLKEPDVARFLTSLAQANVSASTQNQAFNALLFLFKQVLGRDIGLINGVVRAKPSQRLPVVLSKDEVRSVLDAMKGTPKLMAALLYGSGLRLLECCNLRVKDIDFALNQLVVRAGKGDKDRCTPLPSTLREPLQRHLASVARQHQEDLLQGLGGNGSFPPPATTRTAKPASSAATISTKPFSKRPSRKPVSWHIRTVQELLDSDVRTTMIYTHVLNRGGRGVLSPADRLGLDSGGY